MGNYFKLKSHGLMTRIQHKRVALLLKFIDWIKSLFVYKPSVFQICLISFVINDNVIKMNNVLTSYSVTSSTGALFFKLNKKRSNISKNNRLKLNPGHV